MHNPVRLNETQLARLSFQLEEGETLRWATAETRWHYLRHFAGPLFFIAFWTFIPTMILFAMVREALDPAGGSGGLIFAALFPALFIAIGFFMFYRLMLLIFQGGPAIYAITDRRALTLDPGIPERITAYPPAQLRKIEKHAHTRGSGSTLFNQGGPRATSLGQPVKPGFLDIPDVNQAWELLEQLANSAPEIGESAPQPAAAPDLQAILDIVGKAYPKQARFLSSGAASLAAAGILAVLALLSCQMGLGIFLGMISFALFFNAIIQITRFSRQAQGSTAGQPGANRVPLTLAPFQGLDDEQLNRVRDSIDPDETLLWAGQPDPWQFLLGRLAILGAGKPTSPLRTAPPGVGLIMMGLFASSFWPGALVLALLGLLLVAAGPAREYLRARSTLYAVTTRQALSLEGRQAKNVRSFNIESLPTPSSASQHDIPEVEFYGLPDAAGVRRLLASRALASKPSEI